MSRSKRLFQAPSLLTSGTILSPPPRTEHPIPETPSCLRRFARYCGYCSGVLVFVSSIVKLSFVRVVAHESGVSSVDDCRNCQTSTATPAEPGDLSGRLGKRRCYLGFAGPMRQIEIIE